MYAGIETASVIASIAALISWGLSFVGVNKYLRTHSTHDDNGFYMLFSIFVSLAVAIAVAAGSKLLMVQTASFGMGLVTAANIILAIAVMIIWGISFLGITRHLKNHSTQNRQWVFNASFDCGKSGPGNSWLLPPEAGS